MIYLQLLNGKIFEWELKRQGDGKITSGNIYWHRFISEYNLVAL